MIYILDRGIQRVLQGDVGAAGASSRGCRGQEKAKQFLALSPSLPRSHAFPSLPNLGSDGNVPAAFRAGHSKIAPVVQGGACVFPSLPDLGSEGEHAMGRCRSLFAPLIL